MQREGLTATPQTSPEPVEDIALVAALVRGDQEALGQLYDRHGSLLFALALRILHDRAQAEDLLHDVFLEAWHHARDFDPARGTVRAWLVTRARSRALDRRASQSRQAKVVDQLGREAGEGGGGGGGQAAAASLDRERVHQHMASLPAELIAVLELAYFEGASSSEMAERLGIPIGTVKSRMARAIAALRQQLGPSFGGAP
jgi:RNA polymerase sigma-70 factor (ECF subfamily)